MTRYAKLAALGAVLLTLSACYGDGVWFVGNGGQDQIPAGIYSSPGGTDCLWGRLIGDGTQESDIVGLNSGVNRGFVQVLASDVLFYTESCGFWEAPTAAPYTVHPNAIVESNQDHRIGIDMMPGTWQSTGSGDCGWARVSSWVWDYPDFNNVIDSGFGAGPRTVTIAATDVGFESFDCGGWVKVA